ncbi:MAG TPA: kelch repeat-containing protein [Thermoanaerobaculia bacterium]|nr:kelch repeat-containing protein [Thermoanaerobaculia bacterium]
MKLGSSVVNRYAVLVVNVMTLLLVPMRLASQTVPDPRAHHQLVHHPSEGRTYLIGGSTRRADGYYYFDDMWFWDGEDWTETAALPFPRSSHRVVYHPQRRSLVLFGGGFAQAVRAEGIIWEWRAGQWKAIGGNHRAGAGEPEVCYDRRRDRLVIFGGWDAANAFRGETWEWRDAGLVRVDTAGPGPRAGHAFLYDAVRQRCLLFGGRGAEGYLADTWEWDGSSWHEFEVTGPSPRWFFGSATDMESGRIVIFGGRGPDAPVQGRDATGDLGDTWAWDGRRWELLSTEGPPARSSGQMASTGRSIILFGGREERPEGFHDRNDLWELCGRSWVQRHESRRSQPEKVR